MAETTDKASKREEVLARIQSGERVSVAEKQASGYPLTWKEKLENGLTLNTLEDTQADADFNYKQRLKEHQEREAFEARKRGNRPAPTPVKKGTE